MAEVLVAGAFLSGAANVLIDRLATRELISFFSKRKLDHGLRDKLKRQLLALQAVLDDAEEKQISNKNVKEWLDEVQHVVYKAQDLLDQIATKALKEKLEADDQPPNQRSTTQVRLTRFFNLMKQFLLRFNCFASSTPASLSDEEIESKMKEVISELESFVQTIKSLNLLENVGRKQWKFQETTSLVVESDVFGRKADKQKIMELVLSDGASMNQIPVIPIVAMGGMGKTTLAQLIYNDATVNEKFDVKAWVCVSDPFDIGMITKKILDGVGGSSNNDDSLDKLQSKLKGSLTGKKFLIVLDDVWNRNYNDWDLLRRPFSVGAPESRIIVTTRTEEVASIMRTTDSHHLEQLTVVDSWLLFAKHAFGSGDHGAHSDLESIGKEIVEKCKGLPLAVKSLGGLLRSKREIEDWKKILKSEIWNSDSDNYPALRLSYHYLPSHLKRCFAYCSTFPKDYKFEKEKLVHLWMAEDLVMQLKSNESLEEEGDYYFRELLSRCFFQKLSNDNSYFVMHDLLHDLAQHISGKFCLRLDDDKPLDVIDEKVRHFSFARGRYNSFEKFKAVNEVEVKCLRSFISFPGCRGFSYLGNKVLHDMLPALRCLRVLSLCGYEISELPQSIENLILLRYLDLSLTNFRRLSDSVTTLCNLQTLDLSYCGELIELPVNMGKLVNLRHLDIRGTRLTEMPTQMSRMKDLQQLTDFVIGKDGGLRISGLKELCQLRGELCISKLQNVNSGPEASEADLKGKKHLQTLKLKWGEDTGDLQKETDVLDKLEPHVGVKHLGIIGYGGTRFPNWLERAHLFRDMVSLELSDCANCCFLPCIGQLPSLKYLTIRRIEGVTKVGQEFSGNASSSFKPFRSLETLSFDGMPEWEEWDASGVEEFSHLLDLSIVDCPKLTGELSIRFPSVRKLKISGCQQLASTQLRLLLQSLSSVEELEISEMTNVTEFPQQLQHLSSLRKLKISKIPNLTELEQLQQLSSLQVLKISDIPNLMMLPQELCRLVNLERLKIEKCARVVSFPDARLPPMLKTLEIGSCDALLSLSAVASEEAMNNNSRLEELVIDDCSSLVQLSLPIATLKTLGIRRCSSLVQLSLPIATLKTLKIYECRRLEFPQLWEEMEEHNHKASLEDLHIEGCDLLKSLSLGFFPKLRDLEIVGCMNFETISIPKEELQNLASLVIRNCPKMVSFPHGNGNDGDAGGLLVAPNLTSLVVEKCEKLKSLPQQMHSRLPSLQTLEISYCPEIESFPEGGLPSTLRRLSIWNCKKLMKMMGRIGWGLQQQTLLPSLTEMWLSGEYSEEELESFPEEWLLPTTLTTLGIEKVPYLKSINHKGLQHLSSLQRLYIDACPKLECLPQEGLPNTLSYLFIWACPKLECLPQEGLPNSLSYLQILGCPMVSARCQREKGQDWPIISPIRHIRIDREDIVKLE